LKTILKAMNKHDLARSLAKRSHRSQARAADDVDALVHRLIKELKLPQKKASYQQSTLVAPIPRPGRES
jgi:hypothetical protein